VQKEDSEMSEMSEIREITEEEFLALVENYRSTKKPIENVILSNVSLSKVDLSDISISGCIFRKCLFIEVSFIKSFFCNCIFYKTPMVNVDFTDATLLDCKIRYLKMNNVEFCRAKLPQTLFSNVDFSNVDFSNAGFTSEKFGDTELFSFHSCNLHDFNRFYGVEIKSPLFMSDRQGMLVYCGSDYWRAGCYSGNTSDLIEELEAKKQGWQLVAYLSNMLMYANEQTMTDEMRSKIIKAHQRAVSKMQGGAE
jgi:hypothetical protein